MTARTESHTSSMHLRLLGCFRFAIDGQRVEIPAVSARVIAYLGVRGDEVERNVVAKDLWPNASRSRSLGNLRSALWRLSACARNAVSESGSKILLNPEVRCDLRLIERAVMSTSSLGIADVMTWGWCDELLAGWYDDWVLTAREAFQVRRAHALERLSSVSCAAGFARDALVYATLAVSAQPMRESAYQALLRAHIGRGNRLEALQLYGQLVVMLERELDVAPSAETVAIVASLDAEVA